MNVPLHIGVVGFGYFGRQYVRLLQEIPGVVLDTIVSRSRATFEQQKELLHSPVRCATDLEEICGDPTISGVIVATPSSSHAAIATRLLRAGKHVLLEKPLTNTLEEAVQLQGVVRESGKILMVGHQYLYHDYVRHLKEKLDQRILGEVRYCFAQQLSFGPLRNEKGCFWEMASHELSLVDYLFPHAAVAYAKGAAISLVRGWREDFAAAEIHYENGLMLTLVVSWYAPEKVRRVTLGGTKGMAVFDDRREEGKLSFSLHPYPDLSSLPPGSSSFLRYEENEIITPRLQAREPLRNELEHFFECIKEQKTPLTDIEHGVRVIRSLDTIARSFS